VKVIEKVRYPRMGYCGKVRYCKMVPQRRVVGVAAVQVDK